MAKPRYYRVIMGHRGDDAKNAYIEWLKSRSKADLKSAAKGRARPEKKELYLVPFGLDLANDQVIPASCEEPAWNTLKSYASINSRVEETGGGKTVLKLKSVKASRVIVRYDMAAKSTDRKSHITKDPYGYYGGKSMSVPFGRKDGTEKEAEAFAEIKEELTKTGAKYDTNSYVRLQEEDL